MTTFTFYLTVMRFEEPQSYHIPRHFYTHTAYQQEPEHSEPNILGQPGIQQKFLAKDASTFLFGIYNTRKHIQGVYEISYQENNQETRTFHPLSAISEIGALPEHTLESILQELEKQFMELLQETAFWRWSRSATIDHNQTREDGSTIDVFVRLDDGKRTSSIDDPEAFAHFEKQVEELRELTEHIYTLHTKGITMTPFLDAVATVYSYKETEPDVFIDTLRLTAHTHLSLPLPTYNSSQVAHTTEKSWEQTFEELQERIHSTVYLQ